IICLHDGSDCLRSIGVGAASVVRAVARTVNCVPFAAPFPDIANRARPAASWTSRWTRFFIAVSPRNRLNCCPYAAPGRLSGAVLGQTIGDGYPSPAQRAWLLTRPARN